MEAYGIQSKVTTFRPRGVSKDLSREKYSSVAVQNSNAAPAAKLAPSDHTSVSQSKVCVA